MALFNHEFLLRVNNIYHKILYYSYYKIHLGYLDRTMYNIFLITVGAGHPNLFTIVMGWQQYYVIFHRVKILMIFLTSM